MTSRNCTLLWALIAVGLAAASPAAAPAAPPAAAAPRLAALTGSSASKGSAQFRLPQTAIPVDYTITLAVNIPSSNTFTGTVTIKVIAVRNVPFLVLHVNPKVIKKMSTVTVKGGSGADKISESDAIQQQTDEQYETLKLTLPRRLAIGAEYTLTIEYEGTLREDMYGFYRSTYKKNGVDTILAATQFEPTHARSAFPCWDEPQYKATFDISITHDSKLQALSNTPGTPTTAAAATTTTTKFAKTPLMSSYLVAFVVSDFASQASTVNPSQPSSATTSIPYKVWVRPDQVDQAAYAASVGPKILEQMQMYTKIDFQSFGIGKLDLVAIPDFSAGAMENWGLITYRETALMYKNKDESTESSKESIALVVAHEQAHMWFGDLVSPEWWDYTWLNEGFARYFQYVSTDLVNPQWRLMDSFVVQTLHSALELDALASSHPLSAVVFSPDDIQGVFDSISYDKGASVLHMTRKVMGDENFKTALQNYLEEMKFSAARPADLFGALTSANIAAKNPANLPEGVTIGTVLVTWTREAGYPLVTIQGQGNQALVSQTRFLSSPAESSEAGPSWWVPLTYKVQGGTGAQRMWLEPNKNSSITGLEQGKWILANINQEGFYRVNYDESNWAALATYLRSVSPASMTDISVLNRAQLLDDALSLARSGALRYPLALDVTRYLHNETDPIPWRAALSQFSFLSKMLANTEAQDTFKTYVLSLLDAVYKAVGFAETETTDEATMDQNHLKLTFRSSLLSQACSLGHADCVKEATAAFQAFISGTQVKPSQRSAVYCTGLRQGSKTDWDNLWKRYENADTTAGEKIIILSALGCTSDQTTLSDYLTKSLDSKAVRAQDASTVFTAVLAGSEANLDIAFTFFKTNFEAMNKAYGGWSSMQKVVEGLATRMPDKQKLRELENFLATNSEKLGVAQAASVRALETARANMVWREKNIQSVSSWLRGESGTNGSSSSTASLLSAALAALTALLYCRN